MNKNKKLKFIIVKTNDLINTIFLFLRKQIIWNTQDYNNYLTLIKLRQKKSEGRLRGLY